MGQLSDLRGHSGLLHRPKVKGRQYFECPHMHGLFMRAKVSISENCALVYYCYILYVIVTIGSLLTIILYCY